MLVEQTVKIICVSDLVTIHPKDNVSNCKVTILGLCDATQTCISCGLARRNLQYDHAVRDGQIKLTLQWLNIARANPKFRPAHFAGS